MADGTHIQWSEATWNPTTGCRKVSPGCDGCYAIRDAHRMGGNPNPKVRAAYQGLTHILNGRPNWTGEVRCHEDRLEIPLHWRKPRKIFVDSQSDLFHEDVPDEFIDRVFAVMALCPQHVFQILTKRPERMRSYFQAVDGAWTPWSRWFSAAQEIQRERPGGPVYNLWTNHIVCLPVPLPNLWLGVSVEDQQRADERIPFLLQTPAAVRFISAEPLLGPVNVRSYLPDFDLGHGSSYGNLHWVIAGGESGPGARPCDIGWIESLVEQCRWGGTACFVKQLGARPYYVKYDPEGGSDVPGVEHACTADLYTPSAKGGDPAYWPEALRVREFPAPAAGVAP